jgi:diguanylate cyclase
VFPVATVFRVPTLLLPVIMSHLVLAASLWVAIPRVARAGIRAWSAALVLQTVALTAMSMRSELPPVVAILAINATATLSFLLQIAAIRRIRGLSLGTAWLVLPTLASIVPALLLESTRERVVYGGVLYGSALLAIAVTAYRHREPARPLGSALLVVGAVTGAVVFWGRALVSLVWPEAFVGFQGEGPAALVSALGGQTFSLVMSLGFLLVHRERQELAMERLAMADALTGTFNRRMLFELGDRELARARREASGLAVLLLDIDSFKRVNDEHGHQAGDDVLRGFAETVRGCLRAGDLLARYGGEEFCVLLPVTSHGGAPAIAERIRAAVEAARFRAEDATITVTTSLGLASTADGEVHDFPELLRRADAALYRAKHEGRNRVVGAA